jgi:phospholipid/cholesterol/gamma-HCH transport system permease protein
MTRASQPLAGHGWQARIDGSKVVLSLSGNWTAREGMSGFGAAAALLLQSNVEAVGFDISDLGDWDTSLLVFLSTLRSASKRRQVRFDQTGLPAAARQLLAQLPDEPSTRRRGARRVGMIERVGVRTIGRWRDAVAVIRLVGEAILRSAAALGGKARTRLGDLLDFMEDAGVAALPMVAVVNILVGAIVAFVGALQLRRFGAETYIANLVGTAEVREMAPLTTAIVMSGRTGSAYAAEIATMQGSEEIDALRAIGIPVMDYLILPRLFALTTMMPLLGLYAAAVGIFGGFLVAILMMDISAAAFVAQVRHSVEGREVLLGLAKSLVFGGWIAICGCGIGLKAGRSATDVGHAATTAAVSGILGAVALDAVFDLCANSLSI